MSWHPPAEPEASNNERLKARLLFVQSPDAKAKIPAQPGAAVCFPSPRPSPSGRGGAFHYLEHNPDRSAFYGAMRAVPSPSGRGPG